MYIENNYCRRRLGGLDRFVEAAVPIVGPILPTISCEFALG